MIYDVIVIGGGPAGASAAIYAKSRGKKVLLLEKKEIGGLISTVSSVTHYLGVKKTESGKSFQKDLLAQLKRSKVKVVNEEVIAVELDKKIKNICTNENNYQARKVVVAAGTTPKRLWVPGEERLTGKGVRMNAYHDYTKYLNQDVLVIGGADGACKEAIFLAKHVNKVYLAIVEDELACIAEFKNIIVKTKNIEVIKHTVVKEFRGSELLNAVLLLDTKTNETREIAVAGAFSYIGSAPATGIFTELSTENGYIVTNENMETNISGVYAVGDIRKKSIRQVSTAISDGTIAGINSAK